MKGISINGGIYIHWSELAPGKVTYKTISGGYNFIYYPSVKVQLNGKDAPQGYFKGGTTYLHYSALRTFNIPFTYKGMGVYNIQGRTVQADVINGSFYIRWSLLAPGKVSYQRIDGGYNFIYQP
ncbi:hypothetical protein FB550_1057 [Neobacillus bataviensis]|uniref:Uncharacterized protein n=1 Tax=Neobacillus bataviensis TaxID=220685 RepID=A0A561DE29_9BACI|nr:hypothetical protein [Neobacillus bataviensis]TWE01642.1 hypothetical protein FB550_1057 [Neobacillus bataviensis]